MNGNLETEAKSSLSGGGSVNQLSTESVDYRDVLDAREYHRNDYFSNKTTGFPNSTNDSSSNSDDSTNQLFNCFIILLVHSSLLCQLAIRRHMKILPFCGRILSLTD